MPRYLDWDKTGKGFKEGKAPKAEPPAAPRPLQDAGEVKPPHAKKETKAASSGGGKAVITAE